MPSERERFPELFVESNIDRRKCERVVPMKVLVLGFMRTGSQCVFLSHKPECPIAMEELIQY